ncbi:MAG: alpha-galactosidase [Clostridia bacterium]|nr:alpha-galactosidase [Clostridia bacterium]
MIRCKGKIYKLDTPNTTLLIGLNEKSAEYLYYGKRLSVGGDYEIFRSLREYENVQLKLVSSFGEGESHRSGVACQFSDGSYTTRFVFTRAKITEKPDLAPLPSSYACAGEKKSSKTLCLEFVDEPTKVKLFLYYTVFEDSDVIAVSSRLYNGGKKDVHVKNLPSLQLEVWGGGFEFTTFRGEWANERNKISTPVTGGAVLVNESRIGSSSHAANPFVMLQKAGSVYAFNLVYSGNHKESAEKIITGKTRVMVGMNDFMFDKKLGYGESFCSPEAVMCYAPSVDAASLAMQRFVGKHIIREKWQEKERPILINNWEATYFDFNREKILQIADTAAELGVEMFVLDDGWFGHRDEDNSSLGDWFDYEKKTGGIAALAESVRERGLKFGIWVEPEMISEDSELYRKHPEYAMKIPGREPFRIRNQLMLNLADSNVQKYLVRVISAVIAETKAAYVKWDFNRTMTDCFSKEFFGGEYFHEYVKGLYTVMSKLTERFPSVLFEGCAAGGGRFDLGVLCYMPQIWASDNTDARCRVNIQRGTSYGYPASAISCHVSASPNHQTGNAAALETRFNVSACGGFGYEMDLSKLSETERETVKAQIEFFKKYRKTFQFGDLYRLGNLGEDPNAELGGFMYVNASKTQAVATVILENFKVSRKRFAIAFKGLDAATMYEVSYRKQSNYADEPQKFTVSGETLINGEIPVDLLGDVAPERMANGMFTRCLIFKKAVQRAKKN